MSPSYRVAFFSFNYDRDVWRVNQIRNVPRVTGRSRAGFEDGSMWEKVKLSSEPVIKARIDDALIGTTVTVVCIGSDTAGRKYIDYEIDESIARGNGIVPIRIHHRQDRNGLVSPSGRIPARILREGYQVRAYTDPDSLGKWIEDAARAAGR